MYFPRIPRLIGLPSALELFKNYNSDEEEPHLPIGYIIDVGRGTASIPLTNEYNYFLSGPNVLKLFYTDYNKKI